MTKYKGCRKYRTIKPELQNGWD